MGLGVLLVFRLGFRDTESVGVWWDISQVVLLCNFEAPCRLHAVNIFFFWGGGGFKHSSLAFVLGKTCFTDHPLKLKCSHCFNNRRGICFQMEGLKSSNHRDLATFPELGSIKRKQGGAVVKCCFACGFPTQSLVMLSIALENAVCYCVGAFPVSNSNSRSHWSSTKKGLWRDLGSLKKLLSSVPKLLSYWARDVKRGCLVCCCRYSGREDLESCMLLLGLLVACESSFFSCLRCREDGMC